VLGHLGSDIRWLTSYVTDDKVYCLYDAPDADVVEEHARLGGFPVDRVAMVLSVIDHSTGE
jgi:hypothetical protein